MTKYRILQRQSDGAWKPFGVAYEREGRIMLFAPPWRADRTLAAVTLEELNERHCPGAGFQWRAVETTPEPVRHPIDLLRRASPVAPAAEAQPAEPAAGVGLLDALKGLLLGSPELALARSKGAEATPPPSEPPPAPEAVLHELRNNPELLTAFAHLRTALADPKVRPILLAALQAFAQAAKKES